MVLYRPKHRADRIIYWEDQKYRADLKIYEVDQRHRAKGNF